MKWFICAVYWAIWRHSAQCTRVASAHMGSARVHKLNRRTWIIHTLFAIATKIKRYENRICSTIANVNSVRGACTSLALPSRLAFSILHPVTCMHFINSRYNLPVHFNVMWPWLLVLVRLWQATTSARVRRINGNGGLFPSHYLSLDSGAHLRRTVYITGHIMHTTDATLSTDSPL